MNINFQHPYYILLLIPLLALTFIPLIRKIKKKAMPGKQIVSLIIRCICLLLAVCVLAGFTMVRRTRKNSVVIVADLSDSTKNIRSALENSVKTAEKFAKRDTSVGLVTFGYNSYYEIPLSEHFSFDRFETSPETQYTDIYSAIVKAAAMMPSESNKRIILLTDGKENINSIKEVSSMLAQSNIRLDAIISETGTTENEIQMTGINVPETIYEGENFNITVTVKSSFEGEAELSLFGDGELNEKRKVKLTKGVNRFIFSDKASYAGINTYSAEISAEKDSLSKNNKIYTFIKVLGIPKILIVDGTEEESHEIVKIIGNTADTTVVSPNMVPKNIADLRKYNSVILMNVSKNQLPEDWDSLLDVYVRQLGRGLFTTGGSKAYAMGGWADSTFEKILPVNMTVKDEEKIIDIALMILIDNSGSMGEGKDSALELAKQGAINAVGTIKDIDEAGVIVFSDDAKWVSKLTEGSQKKSIQNKIKSIPGGGGTMVFSALNEAYEALKNSKKSMKNIILLTDGYPADESSVYNSKILNKLKNENITVTSIAVGESFSTQILNYLSNGTGGEVVLAGDISKLPDIIFNETQKIMNDGYLVNKTFVPASSDYSEIMKNIGSIPSVDGYVLTEIKDVAANILRDAEDDKTILASWQYGLGKVASLTTDLAGKWSSGILSSDDGLQIVSNVISWILPPEDTDESGTATVTRTGDKGIITVVSPVEDDSFKTQAVILSPSGNEKTVELVQTGTDEYKGEFLLEEEGSYVAVVTQKDREDNLIMSKETALAVRYSDEYDMFLTYNGDAEKVCLETGGSGTWKNIEDIFDVHITGEKENIRFTVPFLIIMLCLLMSDIAIRRLNISFAFIDRMKSKAAEKQTAKEEALKEARKVKMKEKKEKTPVFDIQQENETAKKTGKTEPQKNIPEKKEASSVSALLKEKENMQRKKM